MAGTPLPPGVDGSFPDQGIEQASLEAGMACRFGDIRRIPIVLPGMDTDRPTAHTRLMWGRNFIMSFVSVAANSTFPMHIHPEEQLMMILDGAMEEGVIDEWLPMSGVMSEEKVDIFTKANPTYGRRPYRSISFIVSTTRLMWCPVYNLILGKALLRNTTLAE